MKTINLCYKCTWLLWWCLTNILFVCCHYELVTYVSSETLDVTASIGAEQTMAKNVLPRGEISMRKYEEYIRKTNSTDDFKSVVIGGSNSLAKEFPHMAALGFGNENDIRWLCGGSLISERFVLTAAHCLTTRDGPVMWARLGDLDLASETDDAEPQTFTLTDRIAHPEYKPPSSYNDIALLKLDSEVRFTEYVKPICMPITSKVFINLEAIGWGKMETGEASTHLLKVDLDPFSHEKCNQTYMNIMSARKLRFGIVNETQLCAGGKESARDTCQGDSGGPLQKKHQTDDLFDIVGVTSFGLPCGAVNIPAVYTRVSYFIDWIENIVWSE